jgi:hypothetical protein
VPTDKEKLRASWLASGSTTHQFWWCVQKCALARGGVRCG